MLLPGPEHALLAGTHGAYSLVDELLHSLSFVGLRSVEVTLGIDRDAVHAVELAGLAATIAEIADFFEGLAQDDPDLLVLAVGEEHEPLLRIPGKRDVPRGARAERLARVELLLHELALGREHLHAVALTVAHVDEPVVRALHAMHRVAELLLR